MSVSQRNPDIREETGQDRCGGGIIEIIDRRKGEPPWVTIDIQSGSQIFQRFGKPPNLGSMGVMVVRHRMDGKIKSKISPISLDSLVPLGPLALYIQ